MITNISKIFQKVNFCFLFLLFYHGNYYLLGFCFNNLMTYYEANSGLKAVIFRQDGFNKAFDAVGNQLYHTLHAPVFLVIENLTPNIESLHRYVLDKEHLPYSFSMTVRTKNQGIPARAQLLPRGLSLFLFPTRKDRNSEYLANIILL